MTIKKKLLNKANALVKRTSWYKETVFNGCTKFWRLKDFNLDVINLGSGASFHAFDYTDIKLKCFNMALPSQYLLADYEILKNFSSHLRSGATVILGTSLFSLDGYDVTYFDDRYYTFLYPSSIWHFSIQRLKKVKDIQLNPLRYFPVMQVYPEVKKIILGQKTRHIHESEFEKNAKWWIEDCWAKEFSIDDFEQPMSLRNKDLANQAADIMIKIKNFCLEKNFRLAIITPPIS